MIRLLSSIGRTTLAAASLIVILAAPVAGWVQAMTIEAVRNGYSSPWNVVTGARVGCATGALLFAIVVLGSVFGIAAAIFDIQRSLQVLVSRGGSDNDHLEAAERAERAALTARREPKVGMADTRDRRTTGA